MKLDFMNMKKTLSKFFDKSVDCALNALDKILDTLYNVLDIILDAFCRFGECVFLGIGFGFILVLLIGGCYAELVEKADKEHAVQLGWTKMCNDKVNGEILARERARNEFGDASGKYAFHSLTVGDTFFYKAHALTNTCVECWIEKIKK